MTNDQQAEHVCELCGQPKCPEGDNATDRGEIVRAIAHQWAKDPSSVKVLFARVLEPLATLRRLAILAGISAPACSRIIALLDGTELGQVALPRRQQVASQRARRDKAAAITRSGLKASITIIGNSEARLIAKARAAAARSERIEKQKEMMQ